MNKEDAVYEIRHAIAAGGGANPSALQKVKAACSLLRASDSSARDKISEIESWAEVYFSEGKWKDLPGGLSKIESDIRLACDVIESSE